MKICLINNLYPPFNRGGAERVFVDQFNKLTSKGHQVFVITSKPLFSKPKNQKNIYRFYPLNIFSIYHINKLPVVLRAVWRLLDIFNFHSYFKIKKILTKENPDLIYAHNLTGLGYLIPRLIKRLKIKYIQVVHDVALIYPSGLLIYNHRQESFLIKIYFKLTRFLFNSPNQINFPSEWLKKYYQDHNFFLSSAKQVVRNFTVPTKDLLSSKKLKDPAKVHFLYLGQIEEHKGIIFLINAFNQLDDIGYQLDIIGDGSKIKEAKKLAAENPNIVFHPWSHQSEINLLKTADYTILPSLCYENSPTTIFTSLLANVPVIAPDLGGIPELITVNKNGYLIPPGDIKCLIKILKNVIIKARKD